MVDALHSEQEVVLKSLPAPIRRARNFSGVTILDSGDVCPVLNVHDLSRVLMHGQSEIPVSAATTEEPRRRSLLLAEDSITTRVQEKRILENAGYEVVAAVDGLDAWKQLGQRNFDAVVSDIMMPNMDGLELTRRIRADKKHASLPVILVTSLSSEEDRKRGLEVGADAYLTKPEFDQTILIECLKKLL
jgi:two-component system chemotaxis sensor kinase CheA